MDLLKLVLSAIAVSTVAVAFVVGLFSAPWQVLLVILLGGLWITQQLSQENQRRSLLDETRLLEDRSLDLQLSEPLRKRL